MCLNNPCHAKQLWTTKAKVLTKNNTVNKYSSLADPGKSLNSWLKQKTSVFFYRPHSEQFLVHFRMKTGLKQTVSVIGQWTVGAKWEEVRPGWKNEVIQRQLGQGAGAPMTLHHSLMRLAKAFSWEALNTESSSCCDSSTLKDKTALFLWCGEWGLQWAINLEWMWCRSICQGRHSNHRVISAVD